MKNVTFLRTHTHTHSRVYGLYDTPRAAGGGWNRRRALCDAKSVKFYTSVIVWFSRWLLYFMAVQEYRKEEVFVRSTTAAAAAAGGEEKERKKKNGFGE